MKLNGWKRLGLVAIIVWVLGMSLHTWLETVDTAYRIGTASEEFCESRNKSLEEVAKFSITLPGGDLLEGVPVGTKKEELRPKLESMGYNLNSSAKKSDKPWEKYANLERIKRNVAKMVYANASEADIDDYIASEGTTVDAVRNYKIQGESKPPGKVISYHDLFPKKDCWEVFKKDSSEHRKTFWLQALTNIVSPLIGLVIIWAFSYGAVRIYFWIMIGFNKKLKTTTRIKKSIILTIAIIALIFALSMYIDWAESNKKDKLAECIKGKPNLEDKAYIVKCMDAKGFAFRGYEWGTGYKWCGENGQESDACYK